MRRHPPLPLSLLVLLVLPLTPRYPTPALAAVEEWSYQGVDEEFKKTSPPFKCQTNESNKLAPLNINTAATIPSYGYNFTVIIFLYLAQSFDLGNVSIPMMNDGITVRICPLPYLLLAGGGPPGTFTIHDIHFHWGDHAGIGSEHRIDGRQFSMEMHVVTYLKYYTKYEDAIGKQNSVVIFAVLFTETKHDVPAWNPIMRGIVSIKNPGSSFRLRASSVHMLLLLLKVNKFYRYLEYFSTCAEPVIWNVLADVQLVSTVQLNHFRGLSSRNLHPKTNEALPLVNNFGAAVNNSMAVVYRMFHIQGHSMVSTTIGVAVTNSSVYLAVQLTVFWIGCSVSLSISLNVNKFF